MGSEGVSSKVHPLRIRGVQGSDPLAFPVLSKNRVIFPRLPLSVSGC